MRAIVKNIKSIWNICEKVTKREYQAYIQGLECAEDYWKQNPDTRPEFHSYYFNF